jgi:6-phosphogluconolactonase (cycloisomerase 2 family)
MTNFRRAIALAAASAPAAFGIITLPVQAAIAAPAPGAVYVLSNQVDGNDVLVFDRAANGTLTAPEAFATGGTGTGGGLGSQGAVIIDDAGRYLYAVNAGSDSITSFRTTPHGLERVDVEPSNGDRPTSVTVHGSLLYVLNADSGEITGFTVDDGEIAPIAGSSRPTSGPTAAPGQVSFSPNGAQLIVAERGTQQFGVYPVDAEGVAGTPTFVASSGAVPFGFDFAHRRHLIASEAAGAPGGSAVSSYVLGEGSLNVVSASVPTTEGAACWIVTTKDGKFAYSGNAATSSVTGFRVGRDGSLTILDDDGKTGEALVGVTDLAVSRNSKYLYGRLGGNGTVGVWAIAADGSLTDLGPVPGLPAGAAGMAAE